MTFTQTYQKRIAALVMVVAMGFGFFSTLSLQIAHAEFATQDAVYELATYQTEEGLRSLLIALITQLLLEIQKRQATMLNTVVPGEAVADTAPDVVPEEAVIDPDSEDQLIPSETEAEPEQAANTQPAVASVKLVNTDTSARGSQGTFILELDVTAVEGDVFVPDAIERATKANQDYLATNPNVGFWYGIDNRTNPRSHAGIFTTTIDTTATKNGTTYVVEEGTTERFTLQVDYQPDQTGKYRITLMALTFNTDTVTELKPAWDYRTAHLEITRSELALDLTYETGQLAPAGSGVTVTAPRRDAATIATDTVRDGMYAARFELRDDDTMVDGGTRSESHAVDCRACRYEAGDTTFYGFSIFIPEGWVNDGVYSDFLYQWHSAPDRALGESGKNPNMALAMKRNDFVLRITHDDARVSTADSVTKEQVTLVSDVEAGWHDFVFKVDWSYQEDGAVTAWHKMSDTISYDTVLDKDGANMHNDQFAGFVKWGIYKPSWNGNETTSESSRFVYHDNIRIGDSLRAVSKGALMESW